MHIPNHMIDGTVGAATAVIATFGVAAAILAARQSADKPSVARFAGITALVFAGQMMNFPVQDGTSGHLIGGVLASLLLGVPFGVLSLTVVLVIQCLLFGDGGLLALGANVLTMALIGAGVGGWLAESLRAGKTGGMLILRTALAAWGSVVFAALTCSVLLALSGTVSIFAVLPAMTGIHAMIGVGEAVATVAVLFLIPIRTRRQTDFRGVLVPFAVALFVGAVLSQFASGAPDGLEWVAEQLGFLKAAAPTMAIFPNYTVPWLGTGPDSAGLAGLLGVIATAVFAGMLARMWTNRTVV